METLTKRDQLGIHEEDRTFDPSHLITKPGEIVQVVFGRREEEEASVCMTSVHGEKDCLKFPPQFHLSFERIQQGIEEGWLHPVNPEEFPLVATYAEHGWPVYQEYVSLETLAPYFAEGILEPASKYEFPIIARAPNGKPYQEGTCFTS